jgi:hypothetical protein
MGACRRGPKQFYNRLGHAVHKLRGEIHENLVAFLPGKAGSGASTIVLNTARVMRKSPPLAPYPQSDSCFYSIAGLRFAGTGHVGSFRALPWDL